MHYLFLGEDSLAKDQQIEKIKHKVFSSKSPQKPYNEALNFDFQTLYADKLTPADLKKSLIELPTVADQRLLIIRNIHKLNSQNKDLILEFLGENLDYLVIVFDTFEIDIKNAFLKKLSRYTEIFSFERDVKQNVFEMTNAISACNPQEALKVLSNLLSKGDHPLQLMGVLIWFWGKNKKRVTKEKFHKGLKYLQEADLNIKRSRISGENAVELAVVKLCSLIAY